MRPLNKTEQFLAGMLGFTVFILGNLIVIPRLTAWERTLNLQRSALEGQRLATETWFSRRDLWQAREKWIRSTQPEWTPEITPATLVNQLQALAKTCGVRIVKQDLMDGKPIAGCKAFGIRLRMESSLEKMVDWLYSIQTPSSFVVSTDFSCHLKPGSNEMEWEITLTRYYRMPRT